MNAEAMVQAAPPRPTESDPAIIAYAAHEMAKRVVEEWEPTGSVDEWATALAKEMRYAHRDGYELARELERYHCVSPDSQLVEILEDATWELRRACEDALRKWVKMTGWTPRFAVGDRAVHARYGDGVINTVKADEATYCFAPDSERPRFSSGGGYVVTEDTLTASVDTDPKGGDAKQAPCGSIGSAVPKADAQTQSNPQSEQGHDG